MSKKTKSKKAKKQGRKILKGKYVSILFSDEPIISLFNGIKLYPYQDLAISEEVEDENNKIAIDYEKYSRAYALAVLQSNELEAETEKVIAELDSYYRNDLKDKGEKITETYIKKLISSDERYNSLVNSKNDYKAIVVYLKEILNGFNFKREALFHLGTQARMLMREYLAKKNNADSNYSE